MNCFLLITTRELGASYVQAYMKENGIPETHVVFFNETIKVDFVRSLRQTLSYGLKKGEKKVIVLNNELTIAAQNALLKSLEELYDQVLVFIIALPHETILPTIVSRCKVVRLSSNSIHDEKGWNRAENIWSVIEKIGELETVDEQLLRITAKLRSTLLSDSSTPDEKRFAYSSLKRLHHYAPLIFNNNVQVKIVLEKIFLENIKYLS